MDDVKIGATKCPHCASVLPPEDEEEKPFFFLLSEGL